MRFEWRQRPYLFHCHTGYTDGQLSACQHVEFARQAGVETVIFLEHIRRQPTYDVNRFADEIHNAAVDGVKTVLGFEAGLLPDGTINIGEEALAMASVVGIAEHGFADDEELLRRALLKALETLPIHWPKVEFVWVHPGLWYKKRNLDREQPAYYLELLNAARTAGVLLERNLRYGLLSAALADSLPPESLILGADAHSSKDLLRWAEFNVQLSSAQLGLPKDSTPTSGGF